jgi:hypothetical protein
MFVPGKARQISPCRSGAGQKLPYILLSADKSKGAIFLRRHCGKRQPVLFKMFHFEPAGVRPLTRRSARKEHLLNKFHNAFGEIREDDSSFLQTLFN